MYELEDMLNDCAVIRTTLETLDLFSAEDLIHVEMREIVEDARSNMRQRCTCFRDHFPDLKVLERPLDRHKLCGVLRTLLTVGFPRRTLDSCMKLDVFQRIAEKEKGEFAPDPVYRYEPLPPRTTSALCALNVSQLPSAFFDDLLQSLEADAHYTDKHAFDRNVFQKYVSILFACYKTTDPFFYG